MVEPIVTLASVLFTDYRRRVLGLLVVEKAGNQVHYPANRDCPIFEELASILRKTSGLVPLAGRIEEAFVFGSMAGGKARAGSAST